jgi:hypothetical protein
VVNKINQMKVQQGQAKAQPQQQKPQ